MLGSLFGALVGAFLAARVQGNTVSNFCDGSYTPEDFVSDLVMNNDEFVVTNVQFTGDCLAGGKIDFSGNTHYVEQEICGSSLALSSGSLATAIVTSNSAESVSTNNGQPGDSDLDDLTVDDDQTFDAASIEFDVTLTATEEVLVSFKYVFASEEYNEYAPSQYNDVFAFFVDGANVARVLVEGSDDEYEDVSINTINLDSNSVYYIDNDLISGAFFNTEYDGLTHLLETIPFTLQPGVPTHIKLAVADRTDYVWDSTVYLQAASFSEFSSCSYDFQECAGSRCTCSEAVNCGDCNTGNDRCRECSDTSFRKTFGHACLDCASTFTGCLSCRDYTGCRECDSGYTRRWNSDCRVFECIDESTDCPRIRRPWHLLTDDERSLYIDGFLHLHENGEIVNKLAEIHELGWGPAHGGSGFFPWHRYYLWELETLIRNIGPRFECFGMPYWDWGHETLTGITNILSTGLSDGGSGCVGDDYFDFPNYYTDDSSQCLTRSASTSALSVRTSAYLMQEMLNYPAYGALNGFRRQFEGHHNTPHCTIGGDLCTGRSPYDPIFYLHHTYIDFLWAVWQDCHDYDLVDKNDLDCKINIYEEYETGTGLDDPLDFNIMPSQTWTYINDYNPTHRDMHDIAEWNVVYDKGDFWDDAFVERADNCDNRMNDVWFTDVSRRRRMPEAEEAEEEEEEDTCDLDLGSCGGSVCNCSKLESGTCRVCHDGQGCAQCAKGYFKKSFNHECVSCQETFKFGCMFCQDYNGCGQCKQNYERVKNEACGVWECKYLLPTAGPTAEPTVAPSLAPTDTPTQAPTYDPSPAPTDNPTSSPTDLPTPSIAEQFEEIFDEVMAQTQLTVPVRRRMIQDQICKINLEVNIAQGNVIECIVPDDFEGCDDMTIPDGETDIDITLEELLNKPGVVDTPCLQEIRTIMYPWVSGSGGLLDLCNGFYDPQCTL